MKMGLFHWLKKDANPKSQAGVAHDRDVKSKTTTAIPMQSL